MIEKNYKNIVFICLDGLGINPININLDKDAFLKRNIKQVLTSTFPSTTTNATTSLACNKLPLEHGWFGWSLYFDEINRNIEYYGDYQWIKEGLINIISNALEHDKTGIPLQLKCENDNDYIRMMDGKTNESDN